MSPALFPRLYWPPAFKPKVSESALENYQTSTVFGNVMAQPWNSSETSWLGHGMAQRCDSAVPSTYTKTLLKVQTLTNDISNAYDAVGFKSRSALRQNA